MWFPGFRQVLRTVIGRVLAAPLAALAAWLGPDAIPMPPGEFVDAMELAIFGVVYAMLHKLINSRVNPKDDAAPGEAKET